MKFKINMDSLHTDGTLGEEAGYVNNIAELAMIEAHRAAGQSKHPRSKVGCAIFTRQDNESIRGFNREATEGTWIHAEAMAIANAAKRGICLDKARMAINWFPCLNCAILIVNAGITCLCYDEQAANARWNDPKYNFQHSYDYLMSFGVELVPMVSRD